MERLLFECAIRSTLIAAAAAAVLLSLRIKNIAARHSVWTSVLVLMLALPLVVASGRSVPLRILPPLQQTVVQVAQFSTGKVPFIPQETSQVLTESPSAETKARHTTWTQWIEGIYFLGITVLLLRLFIGMIGANRLKRQARWVDGRLTSASCSSPITVGWTHSTTIFPEGWRDWAPAKLDAVLTHESEHARRHDPLVQWLALVNRALFWFHPLAWWLERKLAALSEEACDFRVLERGHDAGDYSRYLLDLARSVNDSHYRIRALGLPMPGAYLPNRIQKMLRGGMAPKISFFRMAFAGAVFFLLSVVFSTGTPVLTGMASQNTTRPSNIPKWEAVSIKPCAQPSLPEGQRGGGNPGPPFRFTPDRMTLNCVNVRTLINSAYKTYLDDPGAPIPGKDDVLLGGLLIATPVVGGPAWIDSERYMIEAKAEGVTDREIMQGPMLQVILENRFRLKVHREERETPIYALTVAKGGPKLKRFQEGSCSLAVMEINGLEGPPQFPQLPPGQKRCAWGGGVFGGDAVLLTRIHAEGATVDQLARILLREDKPVIDRTGLTGKFDIRLEYAMSEERRQRLAQVTGRPLSDMPTSPSIFTALQEQLGLKLESAKAPVEHLVVDRVERPSPN
jgi:uncharacterized protein (TIGR03435 family)